MKRRSFFKTLCAAFIATAINCGFVRESEAAAPAPPRAQEFELCAEYRPETADWQEYLLDEDGNRQDLGTWPPRAEIEFGQEIANTPNLSIQGRVKRVEVTPEAQDWLNGKDWRNEDNA